MMQSADKKPGRPIRVCHIVATTEGATWVFEQLRDLRDRHGYDVSVILNGSTGRLVDRFDAAGIPVLVSDFSFMGIDNLRELPLKIWSLAQLLKRERFDVVQTHLFHSVVIGRIAAWLADVPVRLAMIAGPFHLEAYTPRWIDKATQWMETALIPSCEFSRQLYQDMGVAPDRLHVVYYGPDESHFEPAQASPRDFRAEYNWPADTPLIGLVAYFYAELGVNRWIPPSVQGRSVKRQEDLVRAMPDILKEFPNAKLLLVGSGWEEPGRQYLAKIEHLVQELGLSDSIKFTGYVSDIPSVLKSFDVTVQASISENLGGTIEGLLMERPMVATRVGGMVDSVIDGETGVLVSPSDPADLARGIRSLLRDRAKAEKLAAQGRALMLSKFTLRKTVEDENRVYQSLLQRHNRGYRPVRQILRTVTGCFVGAYVAGRYRYLDATFLPAFDGGWRPWQFTSLRRRILQLTNALVRGLALRRGTASEYPAQETAHVVGAGVMGKPRSPEPSDVAPVRHEQLASIQMRTVPPSISPRLLVAGRMMRYRFYAFIGRQKLGWGLRARIRNAFRSLIRDIAHHWVAGRMLRYRFYAFVGRQKLGWGLRGKLRVALNSLIGWINPF